MLYLWMPVSNGVWLWSNGENWNSSTTLEELIQDTQPYHGQEAVVFFSSHDVQIIQQNMPKAQFKQIGSEGAKYLLEEYTIHSIDQMKVLTQFEAPDQLSVMGISQYQVQTMQHALNLIPVKVVALLPDFLVLPVPEHGQTILANIHGHLLARTGSNQGFAIDDLALFLNLLPKPIHILHDRLNDDQMMSLIHATEQNERESFNYVFKAEKKLKNHPFNVLPKAKNTEGRISDYWKACAALLVGLLVVQFSYDLVRWVKLKKVSDQTALVAVEQYQSWFGPNSRLNEQNLRSQFESNLRMSKPANTEVLQLISRVGPILMQHQIIANRVSYEASGLSMDLVADSSEKLQNLIQQMNQQGFKAELGNVQTQDKMVVGLVKVQ